jgi:hypothetical protein
MGRRCPASQQHDRDIDALPVQFDQQVDAGNLQQDDDDVDIDGGTECAEQRAAVAETLNGEALLRQFVGQGLAMDWVAVEEKDAMCGGLAANSGQPKVRTSSGNRPRSNVRFRPPRFAIWKLSKKGTHGTSVPKALPPARMEFSVRTGLPESKSDSLGAVCRAGSHPHLPAEG